jgi:hypothetical protein
MHPGPGPLALVGSGEYLAVMAGVEGALIEGRPPRYVQIPTAAAPEGADRLQYWLDLGAAQAERLGVEQVPVVVRDRDEAGSADLAALIDGAGLVYLSGGNPQFLARTLRGTRVWAAIEAAWRSGAALAGCSPGRSRSPTGSPPSGPQPAHRSPGSACCRGCASCRTSTGCDPGRRTWPPGPRQARPRAPR